MAIKRNFTGGPNSEMQNGEHKVTVTDLKVGKSRSGKPMLTVTFTNDNDESVKGFYVLENKVAQIKIKELKVACGLAPDADGMLLNGKRCGIAVERGQPNSEGKTFMQIIGYGKESDVEESDTFNKPTSIEASSESADSIPF
jgi:hypothetical protein